MKKLIPLCIVGLFLCSGLAVVAQPAQSNTGENVTVRFSQPTFVTENNYLSVSLLEGNSYLMEQGKPMLPSYTETLYFPFGTTITSVTVIPSDVHTQTLSMSLAPTPSMAGIDPSQSLAAPLAYGTEPYPGTWYTSEVGCGLQNGVLTIMVTVDIYPVQYHPADRTVQYAGGATIVVDSEPSSSPQPAARDSYQFVAIGPSSYSAATAPLITFKIGEGIASKFVSLDDIYAGTYFPVTGRDNQEKIKYFIKSAIEEWSTIGVLLVGGNNQVPTRDTHVHIADDPDYGYEVFTSDLYYADIYNGTGGFSSWDTNSNNLFGEYNWYGQTDTIDLHPDVYLGRVAATSSSQVSAIVNKIIGYETTPGYQQSWFPNLVVCGGDSFDDTNAINEGEYANAKVETLMTGFNPTELWASNGMLTGIAPTGVANIKNAINAGCGFIDFNGHGNTNIWASHPHQSFNTWIPTPVGGFRSSDIQTLSNGNKLPIVTVEACSTAKFAEDPNCFNWAFLYGSNGGAIGAFGATGLGYSYVGTGVTTGLIGKLGLDTYRAYKTDHAASLGEMWSRALNRYIKSNMEDADYKCVEEWVLLGDPTLAIAESSNPPAKPVAPSGIASGDINTAYDYTTSTTDPDGDQVYYLFDWGDGTNSGWLGPYVSGVTETGTHMWTVKGSYDIKVVSKDIHGALSEWSDPLSVTMPYKFSFPHPFMHLLQMLLERFPNVFPLARILLS
jgi:hypothetical protein